MSYKYVFNVFLSIENDFINSINKTMYEFTWTKNEVLLWTSLWDMTVTTSNELNEEQYNTLISTSEEQYTKIMWKDIQWAKITLTLKSKTYESSDS